MLAEIFKVNVYFSVLKKSLQKYSYFGFWLHFLANKRMSANGKIGHMVFFYDQIKSKYFSKF